MSIQSYRNIPRKKNGTLKVSRFDSCGFKISAGLKPAEPADLLRGSIPEGTQGMYRVEILYYNVLLPPKALARVILLWGKALGALC
jgi:hypothetical protein